MIGWVKLHRSLLDWEWYDDVNVKVTFIHLLLSANHNPQKWRGIEIGRGQLLTSTGKLSRETGLSEKQIRNALKKLESTNEIVTQGASNGTMVTVCKYGSYQSNEDDMGEQTGKRGASEGQDEGERGATNKNNKNNKKDKNEKKDVCVDDGDVETNDDQPPEEDVRKKTGMRPTLSEVVEYFVSNGYRQDVAERAFEYYEAGTSPSHVYWRDSRGNQVKKWKQKMRGVWFKDENKAIDDSVPVVPDGKKYVGIKEAYDIVRGNYSVLLQDRINDGTDKEFVRKMMNNNPSFESFGDGWVYNKR